MEHHLLLPNSIPGEIKVPCVCNPPYYDGELGSFITYPQTKCKSWLVLGFKNIPLQMQIGLHEMTYRPPMSEMQVFYQEWLFFGFLKEVLGDYYNASDFVSVETGGRFISTRTLPALLEDILPRRFYGPRPDEAGFQHILKCAFVLFTVVKTMQRKTSIERIPDYSEHVPPSPTLDWKIVVSIASSAQLICTSLCDVMLRADGKKRHIAVPKDVITFPSNEIKSKMMTAGWCPSEISAFATKFQSIQTLVALSRTDRTYLGRNHKDCSQRVCKSYQIDTNTYKPQHRDKDCPCHSFESEQVNADVLEILNRDNGSFPLLKIRTGAADFDVSVDVEESNPASKYVAISHVWSDGLGRPVRKNSSLCCQLRYLKHCVDGLLAKADPSVDPGEVHLWIDSLCCPWMDSPAKKNAINRMKKTYQNATYVLVIDKGLQSLNLRGLLAWEALLQIFICGWTNRLWTLHEGVIAKSVWIQFRDQPEDFTVLFNLLIQASGRSSRVKNIAQDLGGQFRWLGMIREPLKKDLIRISDVHEIFRSIHYAFQYRSLTRISDEPVCISTLMDIPLDKVTEGEVHQETNDRELRDKELLESRMCKLWQLVDTKYHGIPIGILTLGYPKLPIERVGYRWAPLTLLEKTAESINPEDHLSFPRIGRIYNNDGFLFRAAGFIVKKRRWDGNRNPWEAVRPFQPEMTAGVFRCTETRSFYFIQNRGIPGIASLQHGPGYDYRNDDLDTRSYAIIMMKELGAGMNCEALLGLFEGHLDHKKAKAIQTVPIVLYKCDQNRDLLYSTAESIACTARTTAAAQRMDSLRLANRESEEFQTCRGQLLAVFRTAVAQRLQDENFEKAMRIQLKDRVPDRLAMIATDWFWNDYVADRFSDQKEWVVD